MIEARASAGGRGPEPGEESLDRGRDGPAEGVLQPPRRRLPRRPDHPVPAGGVGNDQVGRPGSVGRDRGRRGPWTAATTPPVPRSARHVLPRLARARVAAIRLLLAWAGVPRRAAGCSQEVGSGWPASSRRDRCHGRCQPAVAVESAAMPYPMTLVWRITRGLISATTAAAIAQRRAICAVDVASPSCWTLRWPLEAAGWSARCRQR